MLDNMDIEEIGIDCLKRFLRTNERLQPDINTKDKNMIWDGYINLFKDSKRKVETLIKQVPIQVKSSNVKILPNKHNFNINKKFLRGYEIKGGTVFIRVLFTDSDHYKIFYKLLLPADIKRILKSMSKDSKSFEFTASTDAIEFVSICYNFVYHSQLQAQIKDFSSIIKIDSEFVITNYSNGNIVDDILDKEHYIYLKIPETDYLVFYDIWKIESIDDVKIVNISIDNYTYYKHCTFRRHKNKREIILSSNIIINLDNKEIIYQFDENSKFEDYISDLNFLINLSKKKLMTINGFEITLIVNITDISNMELEYEKLINTKIILRDIFINIENITYKMVKSNIGKLHWLNNYIINKKPLDLDKEHNKIIISYNFILDKKFIFIYIFDATINKFICYNFSDEYLNNFFIGFDENEKPTLRISKYLILDYEYLNHYELDYESAYLDITEKYDKNVSQFIEQFILECIKSSDMNFSVNLLDLSNKLLNYIYEKVDFEADGKTRIYINKAQTLKRLGLLDKESKKELILIKEKNKDDLIIQICVCLILEYKEEVEILLSRLTNEKLIELKSWPIYSLYK